MKWTRGLENEDIRLLYLGFIEDYCNTTFSPIDPPSGIKLALNELIKLDPMSFNTTSEKLSDMQISYANTGDIPKYIKSWLSPYRRINLVGDKRKKPYEC